MKKILFAVCSLVLVVMLMGCSRTKVYKFTTERTDIEVSGNQGIIYGPTPAPYKVKRTTRELIGVDVEIITKGEFDEAIDKALQKDSATIDKGVWGNAGVVSKDKKKTK